MQIYLQVTAEIGPVFYENILGLFSFIKFFLHDLVSHLDPPNICCTKAIYLRQLQASFTLWLSDVMPQIFMT